MNTGEHERMAEIEDRHWWFRGLRDLIRRCLSRPDLSLPPHPTVLDAGCGTGGNLKLLAGLLEPAYLGGFDLSETAVKLAREKVGAADVYVGDICDPVLRREAFDLVVSLDVLYIPGLRRAWGGIRRLAQGLRPGGLLLLNLPAYAWLYSEHDAALHTRQRFTAGEVRRLLAALGLRVVVLTYRLCALLPVVVFSRLGSMAGARPGAAAARSQLHLELGPRTEAALEGVLRVENGLIERGARLPWGSSVFAIGRKPW